MAMLAFIYLFLIRSARDIEPEVKMEGNKIFCLTYADGQYIFLMRHTIFQKTY